MKKFIIINAIIWALVILLTSYFMRGYENYQYVLGILVLASGSQVSLLNNLAKKNKVQEC